MKFILIFYHYSRNSYIESAAFLIGILIIRILEKIRSHLIFLIGLMGDLTFFKQRDQMTSEFLMIDEEFSMKSNKKAHFIDRVSRDSQK